jgi:hypothetical protein
VRHTCSEGRRMTAAQLNLNAVPYLVPRFDGTTRLAQPDAGGPSRRPPPVLRRRARPRADADARGAERGARPLQRECQRAACTPVAQVRRGILPAVPPPVARGPSPRPLACGGGCAAGGGRCGHGVGGRPLHRDADAQPARPWRRCVGRYYLVRRLGGHNAPSRSPTPASESTSACSALFIAASEKGAF